ncbi:Uncharacterised protein [Raoultella planticola]|nr:Uncharacterised protein [Raoultella planticola]
MLITVLVKPKMFRMFTDILSVFLDRNRRKATPASPLTPHSETEFFYGSLYL